MLVMFLSGHRLFARPLAMATRGGIGVGLEVRRPSSDTRAYIARLRTDV
jgi:hypothetical protein